MFRNKFHKQYLSIFYSCGQHPLKLWDSHVKNGFMRRLTDPEINSLVLEIAGINVSTTYIYTPKNPKESLGIQFPFLIMLVKNMRRYFTFEITVLDNKQMHRRLRISNFQKILKISPFEITMPLCLKSGWVQIQLNLGDLIKRAYGSNYVETTRMKVNANCRLRQIYFSDRLYPPEELPNELTLLVPQELVVQSLSQRAPLAEVVEEHPKLDIHVPTASYNDEESDGQSERDLENNENLIDEGKESVERSQDNFEYKGDELEKEDEEKENEEEEDMKEEEDDEEEDFEKIFNQEYIRQLY